MSSKATLYFSPLECTYLGTVSFKYHVRFVRKMKLKSGHLELWLVYCMNLIHVLLDFLVTKKAAPHECVIRTDQP